MNINVKPTGKIITNFIQNIFLKYYKKKQAGFISGIKAGSIFKNGINLLIG